MNKFFNNLKRQAEENPIVALVVATAAVTAAGKLMDANTARVSAKTHAKEVDRRVRNSYK